MKKIFLISLVFINIAGGKFHVSQQEIQKRTREILARRYGLTETLRDYRTSAMCCILGGCILCPLAITNTIDENCFKATLAGLFCVRYSHELLFFRRIRFGNERQSCWNFCCPTIDLQNRVKYVLKHQLAQKANKEGIIV